MTACWKCGEGCDCGPDTRTPVERARDAYAAIAGHIDYHGRVSCLGSKWLLPGCCIVCQIFGNHADAASIELDLAVAEASRQRIREGVAWA